MMLMFFRSRPLFFCLNSRGQIFMDWLISMNSGILSKRASLYRQHTICANRDDKAHSDLTDDNQHTTKHL